MILMCQLLKNDLVGLRRGGGISGGDREEGRADGEIEDSNTCIISCVFLVLFFKILRL